MMRRSRSRGTKMSRCAARLLVVATLFVSVAARPAPPATSAEAAARRDSARCVTQGDVDACNDAVRRNPGDPGLLTALGDALVRAKRPADAIRYYRRAVALAPHLPGLAAKLSDAENQLASDRAPVPAKRVRYSNAAPETQSH
jgi:cytochrome c-type biogenesis protein CcmH/NrfG